MSGLSENLTPGLKKILGKLTGDKQRGICPKCGFLMPTYPGRYPKSCPVCQTDRNKAIPVPR